MFHVKQSVVLISRNMINNYYCKKCNKGHNALYIASTGDKFCPRCVPKDIKESAVKLTQTWEVYK